MNEVMQENKNKGTSERDFLQYQGNTVPRVIRFAWSVLVLFCIYYLVSFAWPDLKEWLK